MDDVLRGLFACIDEDPLRFDARLVLADWLEEHGEVCDAAGHRWMAKNRWVPTYFRYVKFWAIYDMSGRGFLAVGNTASDCIHRAAVKIGRTMDHTWVIRFGKPSG